MRNAVLFTLAIGLAACLMVSVSEASDRQTEPETVAEDTVPTEISLAEPETMSSPYVPPKVIDRYAGITMTADERTELACVIYLEARGESSEGQQAVAEVVLNRVLNDGFPDTVHQVLHEGEETSVPQFSTVYGIKNTEPTEEQYAAIDAALYGPSILPTDVVFFSRAGENDRVWGTIGKHVFCYEYDWG
jgi:spore germination cell wall hydrolase CwlJ-like protein